MYKNLKFLQFTVCTLCVIVSFSQIQISNGEGKSGSSSASSSIPARKSKILFYNGMASRSHLQAYEPLAVAMANRGHSITFISTLIPDIQHPNITHYCPKSALDFQSEVNEDLGAVLVLHRLKSRYNDMTITHDKGWDMVVRMCREFYASEEFQLWVNTQSFDLVVMDAFNKECALPLAHIWGAKTIPFWTSPIFYAEPDIYGFPLESSAIMSLDNKPAIIPESLYTEWMNLKWLLWRSWNFLPRIDALAQEYFAKGSDGKIIRKIPPISEIEKNISLLFVNTHLSSEIPRSLPPFVQQVGGMHCKEAGKDGIKDKAIRDFIEDKNSDGFFFISFGSFFKISVIPSERLQIFFDAISQFPRIKFLWKWEGEKLENMPKNLFMGKWFPQQELLAHEKCKGLVTQVGLMSFQQAVFHKIPIIAIPMGFDQIYNARTAAKIGFGIHLELAELTLEDFSGAIEQLIPENNKYKKKVEEMSRISRDRPMPAVNTAVYWTEYVLRHDNVDHLKSPGIHQSWWERRLLHIYFAIFTFLFIILYSTFKIILFLFCGKRKIANTEKKIKTNGKKTN